MPSPYDQVDTPALKTLIASMKTSKAAAKKIKNKTVRNEQVAEYTRMIANATRVLKNRPDR